MDLNAFEITLLSGIGTALSGAVGALWIALNKSQESRLQELKESNSLYSRYAQQMDTMIELVKNTPAVIANNQEKLISAFDKLREDLKR